MKMSILARTVMWCIIGLLVAILFDYWLYRMTLPVKPFIYQAF